jgi:hypothetical protein
MRGAVFFSAYIDDTSLLAAAILSASGAGMQSLIGFFVAVVFGYFSYKDWPTIRLAWRSRAWLPTPATVVDMVDTSFVIDSVSAHTTASRTIFTETQFTFEYWVDEKVYWSTRFSFGGHVDQPWGGYSVGDKVTIHYDPDAADQAVLHRGLTSSLLFSTTLCVAGLAWAIAFLVI